MVLRIFKRIHFIYEISCLGEGIFNKVYVFLHVIRIILNMHLGNKPVPVVLHLKINNTSVSVHLFGMYDELALIKRIFIDEEYDIPDDISIESILDLGGNIGISLIYFATRYPNAHITSLEPDPTTFELLTKNAQQFSHAKVVHAAVSTTEGEMTFYKHPKRHVSSSLIRRTDEDMEIRVPTLAFSDLITKGVDLLKIDIEGEEFRIFQDFEDWKLLHVIAGETHEDLVEEENAYDLLEKFEKYFEVTYFDPAPEKIRSVFCGVLKDVKSDSN